MSAPTPDSNTPRDPSLVEPEITPSQPVDPNSLDSLRMLRETAATPVAAQDQGASVPAPPPTPRDDNPPARLNILSVVALVLALTLSPLAALFGYLAVGQIRRAGQRGEGLAWMAVGLGWLWLVGYAVAGTVLAMIWLDLA